MASPGPLLGRRVRWRAGGRLLEGVVIYDGEPWERKPSIDEYGRFPSIDGWRSYDLRYTALCASQYAWGHRPPASRSGLVVKAEWVIEAGGAPSRRRKAARIYYAPRREAVEVIDC
jgi:hypothetical protein